MKVETQENLLLRLAQTNNDNNKFGLYQPEACSLSLRVETRILYVCWGNKRMPLGPFSDAHFRTK